jgi:hypothetical protein
MQGYSKLALLRSVISNKLRTLQIPSTDTQPRLTIAKAVMHNPMPLNLEADYIIHLGRVQEQEQVGSTDDIQVLRGFPAAQTRADDRRPDVLKANLAAGRTNPADLPFKPVVSAVSQKAGKVQSSVVSYLVWSIHGTKGIATVPAAKQLSTTGAVGLREYRRMLRNIFAAISAHSGDLPSGGLYVPEAPRVVICQTTLPLPPKAQLQPAGSRMNARVSSTTSPRMQAAALLEECRRALAFGTVGGEQCVVACSTSDQCDCVVVR